MLLSAMAISAPAETVTFSDANESDPGNFDPALDVAPPPNRIDCFLFEYFDSVTHRSYLSAGQLRTRLTPTAFSG
jgi:hypothetical protein